MASSDDVKKLAALARLSIPEGELPKFSKEFESILAYIGQIEGLNVDAGVKSVPAVRNILREDTNPHAKGAYTDKLVEQFPKKDGNYLSVKQIISYD